MAIERMETKNAFFCYDDFVSVIMNNMQSGCIVD